MIADCNRIEPDLDRPGCFRWTAGYDEAVLFSGDSDFIPAVKLLVSEPFRRRVRVLLPPSSDSAQANSQRLWKPPSGLSLDVVQLTKADLAKSLLPQFVVGANGEKAKCHYSWMWREKNDSLMQITNPRASIPARPR